MEAQRMEAQQAPDHRPPSQLEVHHLHRDRADGRAESLRTLCANCHRLAHHAPAVFARYPAVRTLRSEYSA